MGWFFSRESLILIAVDTLSNLLGIKSDILAISEHIITTSKRDKDILKLFKQMQQAYTLTCYNSFFEALYRDERLAPLLTKIEMTGQEKSDTVMSVAKDLLRETNAQMEDTEKAWLGFTIDLPQPGDAFNTQDKRLLPMYQLLVRRMKTFFEREIIKKQLEESGDWEKVEKALGKVPENALKYFKAQYYRLAVRYPEFVIWLNLQESEKSKTQLPEEVAEYHRKLTELAESKEKVIDIGFKYMEEVINSIPQQTEQKEADEVLQRLADWYTDVVNKPIIDDPGQALTYPIKSAIFIPQAFQVLHYTGKEPLEHKKTWEGLRKRDDLSAFLLSYFNHPVSVRKPLIILGQPGSGKSLLTSMLAARLIAPASSYTPIRVELRHITTGIPIQAQIKEQVRKGPKIDCTWEDLGNCQGNRSPLVIFDGYDELLQATDKVFLGYITAIEIFQETEYKQKPVCAVVTSRISLIDKAVIPEHATIIRLLEFEEERQKEWIARWNTANSAYFEQAPIHIKPFALPKSNVSINNLAEQPLLLMMLAIYDSVGNPLRKAKNLDQSFLYNELLRRFIERELKKDEEEEARSWQKEKLEEAIDCEIERLGVAAIGMFNRRSLRISKEDLGADLKFFELEKNSLEIERTRPLITGERDLPPAEKMFGSFFFQKSTANYKPKESTANKSQGKEDDTGDDTAYEFLHNTFGEFLTADFMLRRILDEAEAIHDLKSKRSLRRKLSQVTETFDGLESDWFARFMYAPLFSRPFIVDLLSEWLQHCLKRQQWNVQDFLTDFDTIVTNHIKLILTTNTFSTPIAKSDQDPFANLPTIGYLAIYTLNLILLRTLLDPDGRYTFDETKYARSIDGTRVWDSLTYLWRSWFSLETLNKLAAILAAERDDTIIHLKIKKLPSASPSDDHLNWVYNVGQALADNIAAGLSGFLLHDSFRADKTELDTVSKMLHSEQLGEPLTVGLFAKYLHHLRRETTISLAELNTISKDLRYDTDKDLYTKVEYLWSFNLESSASLLVEIARLAEKTNDTKFLEIYHNLVPGPTILRLADGVAEEAIRLARETSFDGALAYFSDDLLREMFIKENKKPSAALLIELIKTTQAIGRGIPIILHYIKQDYIESPQNDQSYMPMSLAVQMIKFAREIANQDILDYFSQAYVKVVLESQECINTELAIEMIKLVRDTGNRETVSQLIKHYSHLVEIESISGITRRKGIQPIALMIELFKAVCEVDHQQVPEFLVTYAEFVVEEDREYLSPNLAFTILKFARKTNHQRLIDAFGKNRLPDMLKVHELLPIELAVELVKLAQEQEDYPQVDVESFYRRNITVERCRLGSLPIDTIVDIRRLAQVFGDHEMVERINAKLRL